MRLLNCKTYIVTNRYVIAFYNVLHIRSKLTSISLTASTMIVAMYNYYTIILHTAQLPFVQKRFMFYAANQANKINAEYSLAITHLRLLHILPDKLCLSSFIYQA